MDNLKLNILPLEEMRKKHWSLMRKKLPVIETLSISYLHSFIAISPLFFSEGLESLAGSKDINTPVPSR